jgi:AraC-like DNA-binding protein
MCGGMEPKKIQDAALEAIRTTKGIRLDFLAADLDISIRELRRYLYRYFGINPPSKAELRQSIRNEYAEYNSAVAGDLNRPNSVGVGGGDLTAAPSQSLDRKHSRVETGLTVTNVANHRAPDDRIDLIVELRAQGKTLEEIGQFVSLTRERVRQLIVEYALSDEIAIRSAELAEPKIAALQFDLETSNLTFPLEPSFVSALESVLEHGHQHETHLDVSETKALIAEKITRFLRTNPGLLQSELESQTGISLKTISRLISRNALRFVIRESTSLRTPSRSMSDQQILDSIKYAATYQWPLTSTKYDELVGVGEIGGPKAQRIMQIFGSWTQACELAGVEPKASVRNFYDRRWSEQELEGFVIAYFSEDSSTGSWQDFEGWLSQDDSRPSGGTIRTRLGDGSWSDLKIQILRSERMRVALCEL